MMRRKASAALRNDVRMRDAVLVGCIDEGIYAVVDVLLNAVVYGTL